MYVKLAFCCITVFAFSSNICQSLVVLTSQLLSIRLRCRKANMHDQLFMSRLLSQQLTVDTNEQETDDTAVVKPTSLLCIVVECCSTTRSFSAHSFDLLPSIVAASNQRRPPFCFFPPSHSRLKIKTSRLYFKRCSLICNMPSLLVLMSFTKLLQLST